MSKIISILLIAFFMVFSSPNDAHAKTVMSGNPNITSSLRNAIASDNEVIIPSASEPWVISNLIDVRKPNVSIKFEDGAVVKAPNGLFRIWSDGVSVEGKAIIEMAGSSMNTHGIMTRGAHDFTIKGLTIKNAGGDGVFLAADKRDIDINNPSTLYSSGTVDDVKILDPGRLGLSIMSGKDILVSNSVFQGAKGDKPMSGVDIEPNPNEDWQTIQNIVFRNNKFLDNARNGIQLGLGHYHGKNVKPVSITFENSIVSGNGEYGVKANMIKGGVTDNAIGNLDFIGLEAKNNKMGDIHVKSDVLPPYKSIQATFKDTVAGTIELFKPNSKGKFANVDLGNAEGKLSINSAAKNNGLVNVTGELVGKESIVDNKPVIDDPIVKPEKPKKEKEQPIVLPAESDDPETPQLFYGCKVWGDR